MSDGARILDVSATSDGDPNDRSGIPVGVLSALDHIDEGMKKLEKDLEHLLQAIAYTQSIVFNEIGRQLEGRLSQMVMQANNMSVTNSGEILAIVTKLEEHGLTNPDELEEIKKEKFDKPLQQTIENAQKEYMEELEEARAAAAARELGLVAPSTTEAHAILSNKS